MNYVVKYFLHYYEDFRKITKPGQTVVCLPTIILWDPQQRNVRSVLLSIREYSQLLSLRFYEELSSV